MPLRPEEELEIYVLVTLALNRCAAADLVRRLPPIAESTPTEVELRVAAERYLKETAGVIR